MESLSLQQARKLVLLAQKLPSAPFKGSTTDATLAAIEHLGYVQIDTISVIERAHHHTLWTRNPRYRAVQLDQLVAERKVYEYWAHAAAYLPMCDYRFSLPRKHAIATEAQDHWGPRDKPLMHNVLERIREEGPLLARDFEHTGKKTGDWSSKPAKRALEYLFMQGELMVSRRHSFQKVYELTERVLPANMDTRIPDSEEYARFLIRQYLGANGIGRASEIAYLRQAVKPLIERCLAEMALAGEVLPITVRASTFYCLPSSLDLLSKPLSRLKLKILSPFDNLVIQRKRVRELFDFDYLIECYVPQAKRRYGYFVLPILWDGQLVARMDCKANRKTAIMEIHQLTLEAGLKKLDEFSLAFAKELAKFRDFCGCTQIELARVYPRAAKAPLRAMLSNL